MFKINFKRMPKVKIKKFQSGGNLPFIVNDNEFNLDIQSLDSDFDNYINSDPRLSKDKENLKAEYEASKLRLLEGAKTGNILNVSINNDEVTNVANVDWLTQTQKGLNEEGEAAKPNFLSSITGLRNDSTRSGAINNYITKSLSNAYSNYNKELEVKKQLEQEEAERLRLEKEVKDKANRKTLYNNALNQLDLGSSLYGEQIGVDNLTEVNYNRYHSEKDKQRSAELAYLNNLKNTFNDEGLLNDDDFNELFRSQMPSDVRTFRDKLNAINFQDGSLDLQSVFDSLGLGAQRQLLVNPKHINSDQATKDGNIQNNSNNNYEEDEEVDNGGGVSPFINDTNTLIDFSYIEPTSSGIVDGIDRDAMNSPSAMRYDPIFNYKGEQINAEQYINLVDKGEIPRTSETVAAYEFANQRLNSYKDLASSLLNSGDSQSIWQPFRGSTNEYNNPYFNDAYDLNNIESTLNLTNTFTNSKNEKGTYDFSVIEEKLQNGNIRTRYVDKDGEHFGYYKIDNNDEGVFYAVDESGKIYKTLKLGKVDPNNSVGNRKIGNVINYAWKVTHSNKNNEKPKTKGASTPNSYLKPEANIELSESTKKRFNKLQSVIGGENYMRQTLTPFFKKGGKLQTGGSLKPLYGTEGNKPTLNTTKETPNESKPKLNSNYRVNNQTGRSNQAVNASQLFDKEYKLSEADKLDIGALVVELGGMAATLGTGGAAGVIGGVAGAAGTTMNWRAAKLRGEEVSGLSLAADYGLDLFSAIPFLGAAAKTAKLGKTVTKVLPTVQRLARIGAFGTGSAAVLKAATGMVEGDYSIRNITTLTSGLRGLTTSRSGRSATIKDENLNSTYRVKTSLGDKVDITLNPNQAKSFKAGNKNIQRSIVTDAAKAQGIEGDLKFPKKNFLNKRHNLNRSGGFDGVGGKWRDGFLGKTKRLIAGTSDSDFSGRRLMTDAEIKSNAKWYQPSALLKWDRQLLMNNNPKLSNTPVPSTNTATATSTKSVSPKPIAENTNVSKPFKNWFINPLGKVGEAAVLPTAVTPTSSPSVRKNIYRGDVQFGTSNRTIWNKGNIMLNTNKPTWNTRLNKLTFPKATVAKGQKGLKFQNGKFNFETSPIIKQTAPKANLNFWQPSYLQNVNKKLNPVSNLYNPNMGMNANGIAPITNNRSVSPTNILNGGNAPTGSSTGVDWSDKRPIKTIRANPLDLSELGRAFYNRSTSAKVDTRMDVPMMSNTLEVAPSVKSNLGLKTAYDTAANRLRTVAGQPMSNDVNLEAVRRLSADAKAEEFALQGRLADAENIARQEAEATNLQRQYAANRTAVANQNNSSIAQKNQYERGMKNQQLVSMNKSLDNFWANMNMKGYTNQREMRGLESAMAEIDAMEAPLNKLIPNGIKGLDSNSTVQSAMSGIQNKINPLLQKEFEGKLNPLERQQLTELRNQATQLQKAVQKSSLQRSMDLMGGKTNLFSFRYGKRNPITTAFQNNGSIAINKKGGRLTLSERKELENFKHNQKLEANWIKDYNKWITEKAKLDAKETNSNMKAINSIIKNVYSGSK